MVSYTVLSPQSGFAEPPPYSPHMASKSKSHQSLRSVESADFLFDRALSTRNVCIAALVVCWLAGVGIAGFGAYLLYLIHTDALDGTYWMLPHMVAEGIPLATNLALTLLVESTGYIHTASLRWSLQREGKGKNMGESPHIAFFPANLAFNSNLRLLSFSRTSGPNRWYTNFFLLGCITLAYASSSLTFWHSNQATDITSLFGMGDDYVSLGGIPILFLGLCIIGIAATSTWALCASRIPSWSSNSFDTAHAAMSAGNIRRQDHRCMLSVHDTKKPAIPVYPQNRQKAAWRAHWEVRWILLLLWTLVILCFIWAGVVHHLIEVTTPGMSGFGGWSLVPNANSNQLWFKPPISGRTGNALVIIIVYACLQGPLTFGLHCAELQINLSRDEAFWRKASNTKGGCRLDKYDSIKAAFTSWQSIGLAGFKTVLHWVFGLCVQVLNGRVYFGAVQIVYLALLATLCACYVTYISARRPKGPQPATFGHLQTIVDVVDEWSTTLFWGHKMAGYPTCHAGTSSEPLPPVWNTLYA